MEALKFKWTDEEYLAGAEHLTIEVARNIIELFKAEQTIPFIARYRTNLTDNCTPDQLRKARATFEYIQMMHLKAEKLIKKSLRTQESIPPDLLASIQNARTVEELEFLGAPFKTVMKGTYSERAKKLGLEPPAKMLLEGTNAVHLEEFVNPELPGVHNEQSVRRGIQHIIACTISKNPEVLAQLDKIIASKGVLLQSKFKGDVKDVDKSKYQLYADFSRPIGTIKPHQTLAINRGEAEKELAVKIFIPVDLWKGLKSFCMEKWMISKQNTLRAKLFSDSVDDAIKRLLEPLAKRQVRAKLQAEAERESLNIFALNLRQLLMTSPVNGQVVMGIDPGFVHGCKVAVVSPTGSLICCIKFFLNREREACEKLKNLVSSTRCKIIALGNGKGCRETETLLGSLIKKGVFKPLNVSYSIMDEQGASIYSCSTVAEKEFPDIDPVFVGAIWLARRLQNPLNELVKLDPKHLGVGMYQHDVNKRKLISTLNEIVSECVSFVGVDINTASAYLLRHVAGLGKSKAEEIIKYRSENCPFKNREDLLNVKSIKTKTFLQCAGFIRVIPSTARCLKHKNCQNAFNPLDETWIHPESYETVQRLLELFNLNLNHLGSEEFIKTVENVMGFMSLQDLAGNLGCSQLTMELILHTLKQPKNFDLRSLSHGPIFRKGLTNFKDLNPGQIISGVVRNVVSFGAFIDVGVGPNGLIHISKGGDSLSVNDRVKAEILSINSDPAKINLKLISVIQKSEVSNMVPF